MGTGYSANLGDLALRQAGRPEGAVVLVGYRDGTVAAFSQQASVR
jgi:hypothetical protein